MSAAFQDFAVGKFQEGLAKLDACDHWHDDRVDLDGPFYLGFPQKAGWGEGLLIASLLKRHCEFYGRRIKAFAHTSLCSILADDPSFEMFGLADQDFRSRCARSPLAVLKASLAGELLSLPFVPIAVTDALPRVNSSAHRRIGVSWASVDNGKDIPAKSIPFADFLSIFRDLDGEIVSFQRAKLEDKKKLETAFSDRCVVLSDNDLNARDQARIVREIRALDCMVTISTTTAHIAACLGVPVVLIANRRGGPQWFWCAQAVHDKCFYHTVDVVLGSEKDGRREWWPDCIDRARCGLSSALKN